MTIQEIKRLIAGSAENEARIRSHAQLCGCYHCLAIFPSSEIDPENGSSVPGRPGNVLCPFCGIDAVICEDDLGGLTPLNTKTLEEIRRVAFEM